MKKDKLKFITHKEHLDKMFKKPEFKKIYDSLEPERTIITSLIEARKKQQITQREFVSRIGIAQSALARFESGSVNPTISFVNKVAKGLGYRLTIEKI